MTRRLRLAYKHSDCPSPTERPPPPYWLRHGRVFEYAEYNLRVSYTYWTKLYWATPPWLTPEMIEEIKEIYETAGDDEHVDHMVPLKGRTVSGLHVPWNLCHMKAGPNMSKSNHTWPDMWNEQLSLPI